MPHGVRSLPGVQSEFVKIFPGVRRVLIPSTILVNLYDLLLETRSLSFSWKIIFILFYKITVSYNNRTLYYNKFLEKWYYITTKKNDKNDWQILEHNFTVWNDWGVYNTYDWYSILYLDLSISLRARKHPIVATSSTEAEYIVTADCVKK